jgi:hypothetical protein
MTISRKFFDYLAVSTLLLIAGLSFYLAPKLGDFSYSDAPRHALNGVFVLDFLKAFPIRLPMEYANAYYQHFPALTIGFYPPLVSLIMAGFYAIFGVSHETAQLCISTFMAGLGIGSYVLARRTLNSLSALAVAILTIAAPIVNEWGSQVMLDIPASCFLVWTVIYFCKWLEAGDRRSLLCAVAFLVAGLYTKQTIAFIAFPALVTILYRKQASLVLNKFAGIVLVLTAISLIPLAALTYVFGRVNMESVAGARSDDLSLFSVKAWTYYLNCLPESIGWPMIVLGFTGIFYTIVMWRDIRKTAPDRLFFLLWIIVGYVFFSLIALRMPRNTIQIVFPLAYFSIWLINKLDQLISQLYVSIISLTIALITAYIGIIVHDIHWVDGYQEAAQYSQQNTPNGTKIIFHGNRDGSFIYNMRVIGGENSASIVRSDKLFLKLKIERERGVKDLGVSENDMIQLLHDQNIGLVVSQKDFWTDLPSMSRFQNLLGNESVFQKLKTITIHSNFKATDKELEIYRLIDK